MPPIFLLGAAAAAIVGYLVGQDEAKDEAKKK